MKSINQYYNKKKAELQSKLPKYLGKDDEIRQKTYCNKIGVLTNKRNNKIKWTLHNYTKYLITYCTTNNVSEIVIGYNPFWKQKVNLGKKTNQSFTQIPFTTLLNQIKYKANLQGISVLLNEESYTSKTSAFDREEPKKQSKYKGKRIKRGLFKTSRGLFINSDYNGSIQIGYKVFGNSFRESNIGAVVAPIKVTPL